MPKKRTQAAETPAAAYTDDVRDDKGELYEFTGLERLFVANYLNDPKHSATAAVKAAGYDCSTDESARALASKIMQKPRIKAAINKAFESLTMPKHEVLFRLGRLAAGSIVDVLSDDNELDLDLARDRGSDYLIRKIKRKRKVLEIKATDIDAPADDGGTMALEKMIVEETVEFEIHDQMKALELLGKSYGAVIERSELTGKDGKPLIPDEGKAQVIFYLPDNGRGDADAEPGPPAAGARAGNATRGVTKKRVNNDRSPKTAAKSPGKKSRK